jgi:hypothetical protein
MFNWNQYPSNYARVTESLSHRSGQHNWLINCIRTNEKTVYGKKYQFDKIHTIDQYRKYVPLINYEDIQGYIGQISRGARDILFRGTAVSFERTSGSGGSEKLIPYSSESLGNFRKAILPWLAELIQAHDIHSGGVYWAISPATRQPETTPGGIPVGLPDAAYLGEDALHWFARVSVVPHWVGSFANVADWQLVTLYYLLCRDDLALVSVWSPTFLLQLLDTLQSRNRELLRLLQEGGELCGHPIAANFSAVDRYEEYLQRQDARCLWPELRVISCWGDASSAVFYERLRLRFQHVHFQPKGLLSTEGVVTVPNAFGHPVLASGTGFFEFQDTNGEMRLANELKEGERYEVVMTTAGGLYRYRTGDQVLCEISHPIHPILRFVGRGNIVSDMVGEKLTDEFVRSCLQDFDGFCLLMPASGEKPHYRLILDKDEHDQRESLLEKIERRLLANPQYAYARKLGQLKSLKLISVERPLDRFTNHLLSKGVRLGDIKVPSLCIHTDWLEESGVLTL